MGRSGQALRESRQQALTSTKAHLRPPQPALRRLYFCEQPKTLEPWCFPDRKRLRSPGENRGGAHVLRVPLGLSPTVILCIHP